MSEIVKNELDAIKAFETDTEKRRSELTLNELNYISDKPLHKKGGGTMVATATQSGAYVTLDKTWKELADAMESGIVPVILYNGGTNKYKETVTLMQETNDYYRVSTDSFTFEVDTETGYPSFYAD